MAMAVLQIRLRAPWPWVLGGLRRLEMAMVVDRLMPPHPANMGARLTA